LMAVADRVVHEPVLEQPVRPRRLGKHARGSLSRSSAVRNPFRSLREEKISA
jgi:hypothetical protein